MPLLTPGVSRFKPLGLLKQGRYTIVTLVMEVATQKERVARLLRQPPGATELNLLEGIDRTSRLLKNLVHPNVTRFDRVVEGAGGTWMLFEHVAGQPLSSYQDIEKTIPDDWIVWWFSEMLAALGVLHAQEPPMVIGYLEPADVVVTGHRLVLCDLGLFEDIFPEVGASGLHKHPFVNFIAPEKRQAIQTLTSADLYSVGAIAFWLATGHAPVVAGANASVQLLAALKDYRPDLAPEVADLIASTLSYYPSQRPPSAAEALTRLTPFVHDMSGQTPPVAAQTPGFQRVARTTRNLQEGEEVPGARPPPPPIIDAPGADAEDVAAPTPTAPWLEFLEDVAWQLRRYPVLVGLAALIVLGLGAVGLQRFLRPPPPPPATLVSVVAGHVQMKMDAAHAQYNGEWRPVTQIGPGATVAASTDGATLAFDRSKLILAPNTLATFSGRERTRVSLLLSHGELHAVTGPSDGLYVHLVAGNVLSVAEGTDVNIDLNPKSEKGGKPQYRFTCASGKASLTVGSATESLTPETSLSLSLDGRHADIHH